MQVYNCIVEGEYYHKEPNKGSIIENFSEELLLSAEFNEIPGTLQKICKRMLIDAVLLEKDQFSRGHRTLDLIMFEKEEVELEKYEKKALAKMSKGDLLKHAASIGVYLEKSILGRKADIIDEVLKGYKYTASRLKRNVDNKVMGKKKEKSEMLENEVKDILPELDPASSSGEFSDLI